MVVFLADCDPACWHSRALEYSRTGRSQSIKIDISRWIMHFARYISVYEQLFTCDCLIFSHDNFLCEILCHGTYRTCCYHIDLFCLTFSCVPYFSLFPLQWLWSTPCEPVSFTVVLAKSKWEHLVRKSQPGALGCAEPRCHCLALYQIYHVPPRRLCPHFDYAIHHCCLANF